jgi:hypothetical protein
MRRRHDRLVEPEVQHSGGDPVEVGQLESIEVGQAQHAAAALHREGVRDGMPDAQPGDPYPEAAESGLFRRGDETSVAVEAERPKTARPQHADDGSAPRVVDPLGRLCDEFGCRRRAKLPQPVELFAAAIDEFDPRVCPQLRERVSVENLDAAAELVGGIHHDPVRSLCAGCGEWRRRTSRVTDGSARRRGPDRPRSS